KVPLVTIPDVNWTDDMIWQLVEQIEWNKNWVVLLGKRKKGDKTSGNSKVVVYTWIGAAVLPTCHAINAMATGD
ncbi:hypothetical protein PAXRUDRAFT_164396, partial [Paxillus rubicundulus Ve08.2h10]